jgi:hypothetical protein
MLHRGGGGTIEEHQRNTPLAKRRKMRKTPQLAGGTNAL